MTPGPWQRMDLLARQLMPSMLTLVLVIINVVPLHIPGFSRVAPLLPLIAVYHWAAFRPRLLPAYAVFLIGLFQDIYEIQEIRLVESAHASCDHGVTSNCNGDIASFCVIDHWSLSLYQWFYRYNCHRLVS